MARKSLTVREKIEKSKIKVNPRYYMETAQVIDLCKQERPIDVACLAFEYGYIQGVRATKKEAKGVHS